MHPPELSATQCVDRWASRRRARPPGQRARRAVARTVGATRTCETRPHQRAITIRRATCRRICASSTLT